MSFINIKIFLFKVNVFCNGDFIEVFDFDINGKWVVFFFYFGDFIFVCFIELGDFVDYYEELQVMGVEVFLVFIDLYFVYKVWYVDFDIVGKVNYMMIGDLNLQLICNFDVECEGVGQVDCVIFFVDFDGIIQFYEFIVEGIGCNVIELVCKVKVV